MEWIIQALKDLRHTKKLMIEHKYIWDRKTLQETAQKEYNDLTKAIEILDRALAKTSDEKSNCTIPRVSKSAFI